MATRENLKGVFKKFDADGNGYVCVEELRKCFQSLGQNISIAEVQDVINSTDFDKDGKMNFEEFVAMVRLEEMKEKQENREAKLDLEFRKVFKEFDTNGDGTVTIDELKSVLQKMNENIPDEELQKMFQESDIDGDGRITFEEFKTMIEIRD